MRSCKCRTSLDLKRGGGYLPSISCHKGCLPGGLQRALGSLFQTSIIFPMDSFSEAAMQKALICASGLLYKAIHSFRDFFFFYIYYIPGPSSASKDAGMDQILTIRCLHIATPRPEVIWGYFLTSSFEFLMIGNYSLSSTLNFEPLLGLGITQGTGNRKMSKLHRLVPEKSHA